MYNAKYSAAVCLSTILRKFARRKSSRLRLSLYVVSLTLLVGSLVLAELPRASAGLNGTQCPKIDSKQGGDQWTVSGTLPASATKNASAVCFTINGAASPLNGLNINAVTNSPLCPSSLASEQAGQSQVGGDWGTANACIRPGDTVSITFNSPSHNALSGVVAEWVMADGSILTTSIGVSLHPVKTVGGVNVPIDSADFLAPYFAFASAILSGVAGTLVYVRRVRRGRNKMPA